jgi:phosphoesterase RecJ-like protein
MVPQRLRNALRKKENKVFLISAHVHLEGDALGSELAMARLLSSLGKKAVVVNADRPPAEYGFLPGVRSIRSADRGSFDHDAAVLVDCSDLSRAGRVARLLRPGQSLINIDHHVSNTRFGDVNWVVPRASSACEMVYALYREMGVGIDKASALLLYTGLLIDTGSFRYTNTTPRTHEIAADLMARGRLDVYAIYRALHESRNAALVRALGQAAQTLQTAVQGRIAWVVVKNELLRRDKTIAEQTDEFVHFARSLKGVEVALLFKEIGPGEVRVNLRSTGRVDVNRIARAFGGGGHQMASGLTGRGPLRKVIREVVREAKRGLR